MARRRPTVNLHGLDVAPICCQDHAQLAVNAAGSDPLPSYRPDNHKSRRQRAKEVRAGLRSGMSAGLLRADPTRTLALRRQHIQTLRRSFALFQGALVRLVVDDDAFGLGVTANEFNPDQARDDGGRFAALSGALGRLRASVAERIPQQVRSAVARMTRAAYVVQVLANRAVQAVARERGLSEAQVDKLSKAVAVVDVALSGSRSSAAAVALGAGALAVPAAFVPWGSVGYLAYSTATNPLATLRAARTAVGRLLPGKQVLGDIHANALATNATEDEAGILCLAWSLADWDDRWFACLTAALDAGADVQEACQLATDARDHMAFPDEADDDAAAVFGQLAANAGQYAFPSDHAKLEAFQAWLKKVMQSYLVGKTQEELWRRFAEAGFKKGAARAFDDVRPEVKEAWQEQAGFHQGTREEFLRSSFAQPVAVDKLKILAARSFDEMENVSDDMEQRLSRTLLDGLATGDNPHEVAADLVEDVGFSRQRAETVARTELIRAHAEGQLVALEKLGVEEVGVAVEWSVSGLGTTARGNPSPCPLCAPMEGVVLKLSEARGLIPRHPNCMCAWVPANVGEDATADMDGDTGQKTTAKDILAALDESGLDVDIAKQRPQAVVSPGVTANAQDTVTDLAWAGVAPTASDLADCCQPWFLFVDNAEAASPEEWDAAASFAANHLHLPEPSPGWWGPPQLVPVPDPSQIRDGWSGRGQNQWGEEFPHYFDFVGNADLPEGENCGIGPHGFLPGNTCAKGGGGAKHATGLDVGAIYTKMYKGEKVKIEVLDNGFKVTSFLPSGSPSGVSTTYGSLSAAAKGVKESNSEVNGWAFFGIPKPGPSSPSFAAKVPPAPIKLPVPEAPTSSTPISVPTAPHVPAPIPATASGVEGVAALSGFKFIKDLPGSTKPKLMEDPSGKQWVVKSPKVAWEGTQNDQLKNEAEADHLYRKLGIATPASGIITDSGTGKIVKMSEFHEGVKQLGEWEQTATPQQKADMHKQIGKNFVADALLSNWDVVGLSKDNILVTKDGTALRADNGGALKYRAQGAPKGSKFGAEVGELETLRNPGMNPASASVYKHLTNENIRDQIKDVLSKKDTVLGAVTDPATKEILSKRFDYLQNKALGKYSSAAYNDDLNGDFNDTAEIPAKVVISPAAKSSPPKSPSYKDSGSLPEVGGSFSKSYDGKDFKVTKTPSGYQVHNETEGKDVGHYTSLSSAAKGLKGNNVEVNGWAFFKMKKEKEAKDFAPEAAHAAPVSTKTDETYSSSTPTGTVGTGAKLFLKQESQPIPTKEQENWWGKCSKAETSAVKAWTGSTSSCAEMRRTYTEGKPNEQMKNFISAMEKAPKFEGTLYRGVYDKSKGKAGSQYATDQMAAIEAAGLGGTMDYTAAPPSCSTLKPQTGYSFSNGDLVYKFLVKTARSIDSKSAVSYEKEILQWPAKYKIVDIQKNAKLQFGLGGYSSPVKMFVTLEEI